MFIELMTIFMTCKDCSKQGSILAKQQYTYAEVALRTRRLARMSTQRGKSPDEGPVKEND